MGGGVADGRRQRDAGRSQGEAGGRTRGGADDEAFAIVLDLGLGQRIQIGDDLRPGAPGSGARAIKKGLAFGSKESMNAHARGC